MADVGVLNLQINDNSQQAADGLDKLGEALARVRNAVKDGLKLASIANGLEKLGRIVNESISGSTIVKIGQLADELSKLKGLGDLNIKINGGTRIESIRKAVQETIESMKDTESKNTWFDNYAERVVYARQALDSMNGTMNESRQIIEDSDRSWAHGAERFGQLFEEMSRLRMMFSLPAGAETGISTEVEDGWTEWKDGAIEVEGTVSDAMENVAGYLYEGQEAIHKAAEARNEFVAPEGWETGSIEGLVASATELGERLRGAKGTIEQYRAIEEVMNNTGLSKNEIVRQLMEIEQRGRKARDTIKDMVDELNNSSLSGLNWSKSIDRMLGIGAPGKSASDSARVFEEAFSRTENITETEEKIQGLNPLIQEYNETAKETSKINFSLSDAFGKMKSGVAAMFPTLSGMIKRFGQIAKYRMLRAVLKHITAGFSEGVQNVYQYSKAIGGSFAESMDSAASALLQMKNSVGAAVAPVIQSLIPLLQTLVGWFIDAVNYANQFFALLNGQKTWTRAIPATANAFDKQTKAAKGAAAAVKDLLADWDELNIIQSETGGGGSGSGAKAAEDYLEMFEEVSRFDNNIKKIFDGINDQFGGILGLAERVGAAILGWKLSTAFTGWLGTLGAILATAAIVDIVFNLTTMLDNQYFETGEVGYVVADVLQTALGSFLASKVIGNVLSAGAGNVAASIVLTISALADVLALVGNKDVTALSEQGIVTEIKSALKLGAGFFLTTKAAGLATGTAALAAGEAASIWLAAAIGIKAIATYADTKELTKDRIVELLTAVGIGGAGVTFFELLGGAGIAAAATAGGVTALALGIGFAAAVGVVALLNLVDSYGIQWGEKKLTEEQVETFVSQKMFTVDVPTTVKIISEKIAGIDVSRETVEEQLLKTLGDFEVIKLGIATKQDYAQLHSDVDELISTINGYVDEAKAAGRLTIQFTPGLVGGTGNSASNWYKSYTEGWDTVNRFASEKGAEIGRLLTKGEKGALEDGEPELLATLMEQLNNVTAAMTRARTNSKAFADLQFGLGDLSQASFDDIVSKMSEYKLTLSDEYKKIIDEQYALQGELVAALLEIDPNMENQVTKDAVAEYERMGKNLSEALDLAVAEAAQPGVEMMTKFLADKYKSATEQFGNEWNGYLDDLGFNAFNFSEFLGADANATDAAVAIKDALTKALKNVNNDLGKYIEELGLNPFEFIDKDMRGQMEKFIRDTFDQEVAEEIIQRIAPSFTNELNAGTNGASVDVPPANTTPFEDSMSSMQSAARDTVDNVKSIFSELDDLSMTVSVNVDGVDKKDLFKREENRFQITQRAGGGPVRSGDLVMADENGRFEMMGRMGNQPVVANNQQIVNGISRGVATANGDLLSALNTLIGLAQQINRKPFTVNMNPTSTAGNWVARSTDALAKTTGG